MKGHIITISCPKGPEPEKTRVSNGDTVTFKNSTGGSVKITFDNPGVFNPSPHGSINIAKDDTKKLTIGRVETGTGFSYPCGQGAKFDTRTGRIDP